MGGGAVGKYVEIDTKTEYHPLSDGDTLMLVRKDTGEIIHEHVVESEENRKKRLERRYRKGQPPFARLWMANLIQIVREKKLSNPEAGLLFKLMAFLNWQSTILVHPDTGRAVNTKEIAEFIGIDPDFLSKQLDKLIQKGLISRNQAGRGRSYKYNFNCHLAFFGSKMNDITEKDLFDPDTCDYTPAQYIQFKQEENERRKQRRM